MYDAFVQAATKKRCEISQDINRETPVFCPFNKQCVGVQGIWHSKPWPCIVAPHSRGCDSIDTTYDIAATSCMFNNFTKTKTCPQMLNLCDGLKKTCCIGDKCGIVDNRQCGKN